MSAIDISVVIVNYNVKDFLSKCLDSVKKASANLNVEIIVVDNNSSDGSIAYLQNLHPDVQYFALNENLGFSKANNIGFKHAKGKYILILNPDTILEEKNLDIMYDYMENNPQVGLAGCKVLNPDGSFQLPCRRGFPTPWVSFCKLFGLQTLFPKSKLFAQYNQTFRSIDETYYIDAVMGAYMFTRRELIESVNGFDEDFFMYGEDLDLCHRVKQAGFEIAYFHETSIVHYKGESTKRSSINEIKHFYSAMAIFSKKHFAKYSFFLFFLKFAIAFRSIIAYSNKFKEDILYITGDLLIVNLSLVLAGKIRFGSYLPFPDYAYPIVFIAVSVVLIISMIFSGEYFEDKHSVSKSVFGILINFFLVSALTYFFKEFAFSRGIILIMTGLCLFFITFLRLLVLIYNKAIGTDKDKRILIVGLTAQAENIADSLKSPMNSNINLIGFLSLDESYPIEFHDFPVVGNIHFLKIIIEKYHINEIVIADKNLSQSKWFQIIAETSNTKAKYHLATEYNELLTSEIIEDITEKKVAAPNFALLSIRSRFIKRFIDLFVSIFALTLCLPITLWFGKKILTKKFWSVLIGNMSIVGLYAVENNAVIIGKKGITGLAHISSQKSLPLETIESLNDYYLRNYSIALDLEIIVKSLLRRKQK